jgi:hypothetical protein
MSMTRKPLTRHIGKRSGECHGLVVAVNTLLVGFKQRDTSANREGILSQLPLNCQARLDRASDVNPRSGTLAPAPITETSGVPTSSCARTGPRPMASTIENSGDAHCTRQSDVPFIIILDQPPIGRRLPTIVARRNDTFIFIESGANEVRGVYVLCVL